MMEIRRLGAVDSAVGCEIVRVLKYEMDNRAGGKVAADYMRQFLSDEGHYLLAAFAEGRPVGFVLGYRWERVDGPARMMFLYEIGVHEDYRGRGIGRALIAELARLAREAGCVKMFAPTNRKNRAAMALYRSAGGREGGEGATGFEWEWPEASGA